MKPDPSASQSLRSQSLRSQSLGSRSRASSSAESPRPRRSKSSVASRPEEGSSGRGEISGDELWALAPRWESDVCEPAAAYEIEAEPVAAWPWSDALEEAGYSIRVPVPSGPVSCARCQVKFPAAGPTGFAEDRPVCDMCLLEGSSPLGMVMALIAVVRAFGGVRPSNHHEYRDALGELGAFSRIYEKFAAKSGPPRVFRIPSFEVEL